MARSVEEIHNQILATKNAYLPELDSTSKVSIYGLIAYIQAVCIHYVEVLFDIHKAEVQNILDNRQPATRAWYYEKTLKFQLGDNVDITGNYPVIGEAKQIVSRAAVKETIAGEVVIKVAKGTIGQEIPLTDSEKLALDAYIDKIKYAGTRTNIVSLNADLLNIEADVYFDPIYTFADIQARVEAALYLFMATIDFGGVIYKNDLVQAIRAVPGVNDIVFTTLDAQAGATITPITREYEMISGYLKENVVDYPFATSINYIPEEL